MLKNRKCKWLVEIEVADVWVADGLRINEQNLQEAIDEKILAGLTKDGEIVVRVIKSPTDAEIQSAEQRLEHQAGKS